MLVELRVHKTPKEIEIMRLGNLITSQAHVYVMRHVKPGMVELQCEALFKAWCNYFGASRHCVKILVVIIRYYHCSSG